MHIRKSKKEKKIAQENSDLGVGYTPVIPALRQEDYKLEASLG